MSLFDVAVAGLALPPWTTTGCRRSRGADDHAFGFSIASIHTQGLQP